MDDYRVLLYILFGIIWLVFKVLNRKKEPVTRRPEDEVVNHEMRNPEQRRTVTPKTPTSFEDLLREFAGETKTEVDELEEEYIPNSREKKRSQEVVNPWEATEETRRSWEVEPPVYENLEKQGDEEAQRVYEESVRAAKRIQTLDETVRLDTEEIKIGKIETVEDLEKTNNFSRSILNSLKDPESAKKAIILSEILNRKY